MYEMWKGKQIHEDARKMYRAKILVKKIEKMVKTPCGRSGQHEDARQDVMDQNPCRKV